MSDYEEHPSKTSAWRDGRFVVHPEAAAEDSTVWFGTGDSGPEGLIWEGLLCRRLSDERVRICAIPFWLYDVSIGDEVAVMRSGEGALVADGTVQAAGNFTFRVILSNDGAWQGLMRDLEPLACWFDIRTPTYIAIACPPERAQELADELQARESRGELQYETGRSQ